MGHENLMRGDMAEIRREMDRHFFGTLAVTRPFGDSLARNRGGAVVNILSALSWFSQDRSTAEAAEWSLTNTTRVELAAQGAHVQGVTWAPQTRT